MNKVNTQIEILENTLKSRIEMNRGILDKNLEYQLELRSNDLLGVNNMKYSKKLYEKIESDQMLLSIVEIVKNLADKINDQNNTRPKQ